MFVVFIGGVPAVAIATAISIRQVPPTLTRAARTMGAKGWTLQRTVVLPACVPGYWTGLQQAWAVAWRALLAAEIIRVGAARGLGHLLEASAQDIALIIAVMGVIVVIGLAIDYGFSVVDRRIRGKRGSLVPA
jgi:NitT/TauT family transport system permease protein